MKYTSLNILIPASSPAFTIKNVFEGIKAIDREFHCQYYPKFLDLNYFVE